MTKEERIREIIKLNNENTNLKDVLVPKQELEE